MALLVDRMVDEREAVIKPLGPLLEKQRRYSGALQLGDGRLALLLNPSMLIQLGRGTALIAPHRIKVRGAAPGCGLLMTRSPLAN